MSKIKIENSVPLPRLSNVPPLPLDKMKEGDSFVIEANTKADLATIRQRTHRYQTKYPPVRFSVWREDESHVRVFRVSDANNK